MTTTVTPLTEILSKGGDSYDGFDLSDPDEWHRMMTVKMRDEDFWPLVESMETHGQITPVMWRPEFGEIGNGHHRLVAALLLGWDTILTTEREEWSPFWPQDSR